FRVDDQGDRPAGDNVVDVRDDPAGGDIQVVPHVPLRLGRDPIQHPPGRLLTGTPILRSIRPEVLDGPAGDPVHGAAHQMIPTRIEPPNSTSSTNRAIFTPAPLRASARSSESFSNSGPRPSPNTFTSHRIRPHVDEWAGERRGGTSGVRRPGQDGPSCGTGCY